MNQPIRVLIADDQSLVRGGFRVLVENEPDMEVVAEAADGLTAIALAHETRPDVILMDIQMPGTDGIAAVERIVADPTLATTRIILVTTFDTDANLVRGFTAGASGFVLKNIEPAQLLQGIRIVAAGEELLSAGLATRLLAHTATTISPEHQDGFDRLTEREREVVILVAEGLSNREISAKLYISEATTKTHVSRAITKTGSRDRAQLVAFAYRAGVTSPRDRPS